MSDTMAIPSESEMSSKSQFYVLVRKPSFLVFWLGRIVSSFGDILFTIATMWYVLGQTQSPLATAIIPLIPFFIYTMFSQPLATIADRLPKKLILVGTDISRAIIVFVVASLIFLNKVDVLGIYVASFLLTVSECLFDPAQNSALPKMLHNPDELLSVANSLLSATTRMINLFGYALGGVIVSIIHPIYAVAADSLSFIISALSLALLSIPALTSKGEAGVWGFIKDSFAGMRFIWERVDLRTFGLFVAFVNFVTGPASILTVVFSRLVLHTGLSGYGYLEAAWAIGGVFGAVVSTWASKKLRLWQLTLIAFVGAGIALASMPIFVNLWESILALAIASVVITMFNIPLFTALQLMAPDELRGRITASFGLFANIGNPLGLVIGSWLMEKVSPSPVFLITGLLLSFCGLISLGFSSIRNQTLGKVHD